METENSHSEKTFVAVHAGAGNHSTNKEHLYKNVCKQACLQAITLLKSNRPALEVATAAVKVLEDDEITNAGYGSSLSWHGVAECEASVMDGQSMTFGAVGVLSGVKNPVSVACKLVDDQKKGPLPFGRIRPSILVGKGAQMYCTENGFEVDRNLISTSTMKTYNKYKRKCGIESSTSNSQKKRKTDDNNSSHMPSSQVSTEQEWVQDTVGAICVDHKGNVAAASSSGGIWLKHPGRLGPIAMYGAGCWAQNGKSPNSSSVTVVTSGCGEQMINTLLAKTTSDGVRCADDSTQALATTFKDQFLESELLQSVSEKLGGALVLKVTKEKDSSDAELFWIHSTSSMALAFMGESEKEPKTLMSRLDDQCLPGKSFTMGGHVLQLAARE